MKRRLTLAFALIVAGAACRPERIVPPVVMEQPVPQDTKAEVMERVARKKKAEAARLAKAKKLSEDALERGRERLRDEQHQEALEAFQEAVRLDHHSADAWIRIAYVCEQEGDMVKASEAFREAKKLWAM